MTRTDTIVAAATPPGRGGVGIVRVSGPKVPEVAAVMLGELPKARRATLARFLDAQQEPIDAGLALFFPAPHSYTGEHSLELHGHGGPVVMDALIARAVELGARRAHAGEFTQRAFLNDKLDLAQAEAVADLIDAGSREALRAAMRSLQGEFSAMVRGLTEAVIELRSYIEAAIDFPEEEIDFLADHELGARFEAVRDHFEGVLESARQGRLLREGMTVADTLTGPPHVTLSALTGRGLDELRAHLKQCMGYQTVDAGAISARRRHLEALARAREHTEEAARQLTEHRAGELVAEELRAAQHALGEITGEFTSDDLLGRIFAGFCIGK